MIATVFIACLAVAVGLAGGETVQNLTRASNSFSQRLYQKIALYKSNAVYSPFSIHLALAMASSGARGLTEADMLDTLGVRNFTSSSVHELYRELINATILNITDQRLWTANGLFVNPKLTIEPIFQRDVAYYYNGNTNNFNPPEEGGPEKQINEYIESQTEGQIKNILQPKSIDQTTLLVLVNTVYFNATWNKQFEGSKTTMKDFYKVGGRTVKVNMMYDERVVNMKKNVEGADVAELPFKDRRFSLCIALPQKKEGITALEKSLTDPRKLERLFEGLTPRRVRLSVPKFKIESSFKLVKPLSELGMARAFDKKLADFRGLTKQDWYDYCISIVTCICPGKAYISQVFHKTMIEVMETGTVAAASTHLLVEYRMMALPPEQAFTANHPFLFFVRDNLTRNILFQGKYSGG